MSWLANRSIRKMTDPADGTLVITATSPAPTLGQQAQSFWFTGVVQAPELPSTAVELTGLLAAADQWPQPGSTLPVVVDRADPQHVVIRWDEVPTARSLARAQTQIDALRQRTGIDAAVLEQAMVQPERTYDAPVRPQLPGPSAIPAVPAVSTLFSGTEAAGTVVAGRDVALPPGLAPAGGISDLTIRLDATGAIVVARARFASMQERAQLATPGAPVKVLLDASHPGLVTLVTRAEPA